MRQLVAIVLLMISLNHGLLGQNVPLGNWQTHFSNLSGSHVIQVRDKIIYATYNGLLSVNQVNKEIKAWSKLNGLHDVGISSMAYQEDKNLLLLAYRSGNIDFISLNELAEPEQIEFWQTLNQTTGLPAKKEIRRITFSGDLAYLATNFGIIALNTRLRQVQETYRYIGSSGQQVSVNDLTLSADSIYAVTSQGIRVASRNPAVNLQYFANWHPIASPGAASVISIYNGKLYGCFFKLGLYTFDLGRWNRIYASDSEDFSMTTYGKDLVVTALDQVITVNDQNHINTFSAADFQSLADVVQTDDQTFWAADRLNGLITNEYSEFEPIIADQADTTISPRPDSSVVDFAGLIWSILPDQLGGGILVKQPQSSQQRVLSTSPGSGALPSNVINSLAIDNDGLVWFCSDRGAGYISPADILSAGRVDAVLPVYGQRRLFANEKCTSLAIEPGNRKWIGTRDGLFLFNADGTELIQKFTAADSPLPSNEISRLRFEPDSGILFVETPNGMVSYRSNSTSPAENLQTVTIFPNPVRPGYAGSVGMKGLMDDSVIKVTELSGRLVFETRSQGGTASWNLTDYTGKRARGGIYMVLVVSGDGTEKVAGKLAVID